MPDRSSSAVPAWTDDWPNTTRLLPWLIALFMAMIFLVPFDSARLPFGLPFDAKLDRLVVAVIAVVWLATIAAGKPGAPRLRRNPVNLAIGVFVAISVASVLLNLQALANAQELSLALKKLVLLGSFITFFFIVSSSVRPGEVRPFLMFVLGLSVITAIGVIVEYRTGTNAFWQVTDNLLPGNALDPTDSSSTFDATGRRGIIGPTAHGLAVTTMLSFLVPVAIMGVMRSPEMRGKIIYGAITAILLAGSVSTVRKSAAIVPIVGFLVLALYRPRAMFRLSPLFLTLIVVVHFMAPGAMGSIKSQLFPENGFYNSPSVVGRTADYAAIKPDLQHHMVLGRGYGTFDPDKYRLLDNQYLGLRIGLGWLGYLSYIALMLAVAFLGHLVVRTRDPSRAPPALIAVAAAGVLGAASKLFDALAFAQVPYTFLFIAALTVAVAGDALRYNARREPAPARARPVTALTPAVRGG